jgi:hypothetical protein
MNINTGFFVPCNEATLREFESYGDGSPSLGALELLKLVKQQDHSPITKEKIKSYAKLAGSALMQGAITTAVSRIGMRK